ncbi:4-alpha-glucanotransferase [Pseudoalteromonas sp. BDTF-M6]|uniref:4-alpha-glucanotransferase n=1 Tax=Pseudoalteromonas sp. BDTF-M6 TaxID=2796132 RepID=UPI001BAF32EA|nr:4-alpha-glucanotransferase [Pseudoalteromonas sp. BDTF-M6]MBS3796862.1 4-alpha-glucanotransferase [Pseudoalteromonas sp. BDTF-M6]
MDTFAQACYLMGVGYEYHSYEGELLRFSDEVRSQALAAMAVDGSDLAALSELNYRLDAAPWQQLVDDTSLVNEQQPRLLVRVARSRYQQNNAGVHLTLLEGDKQLHWSLAQGEIVGDYHLEHEVYLQLAFNLPEDWLAPGFYDAQVSMGEQVGKTQLWWVPALSYQPPCFTAHAKVPAQKLLGLSFGLYTLISERGVGIGDFSDLAALVVAAAEQGIDYLLLNPLHLLDTTQVQAASPYSPVSRLLLHPLYISIELSEDCDHGLRQDVSEAHVHYLSSADGHWLDYERVYALKWPLLQRLYANFCASASDERRRAFAQFQLAQRDALDTLPSGSTEQDEYWQWQAWLQRKHCQQLAITSGMRIGLINDLAVGVTRSDGEYRQYQSHFTQGAEIGAPPDPFARQGQNWGMPALHPKRLASEHFAYFKSLLSANMHDVGALRIDHVMALRRLWWCLADQQGCYVYYPFEALLAAVKILSHQERCAIIGEDLGVVPPQVKTALAESRVLTNTVFYFCHDHRGFFAPEQLPEQTLLMISNHDLPPFAAWWQGGDIDQALELQLIDNEQAEALRGERQVLREQLLGLLGEHGQQCTQDTPSEDIYAALCRVLARAPSRMLTLQLDDLDNQRVAVNVPGTHTQYPNWRRQLSTQGAAILARQAPLLQHLGRARHGT